MEDEAPSIKNYVYTITGQIQNSESCLCFHALSYHIYYLLSNYPSFFRFVLLLRNIIPTREGQTINILSTPPFLKIKVLQLVIPLQLTHAHVYTNHWQQCLNKRSMETLTPCGSPSLPFDFLLLSLLDTSKQQGPCSAGNVCSGAVWLASTVLLYSQDTNWWDSSRNIWKLNLSTSVNYTLLSPQWSQLSWSTGKQRALNFYQNNYSMEEMQWMLSAIFFKNASELVKLPVAEPYLHFCRKSASLF